ncbi:glycoside hydrolase family 88 protein [Posidoniimonas polymericola]|nr:glycoside hydrolase family 88 protein [Posidoniimonas polymericola]
MRPRTIPAWVCALLLTSVCVGVEVPDPAGVLADMTLANDYFMAKWPDPTVDIVTNRARPSNIWTRATYYEGLMALHQIDASPTYYNYAVDWAAGHNWQPAYGGTTTTNADNQAAGQTYLELYQIDPQPERLAPIKTNIDRMLASSRDDYWSWVDAVQMAMPVFAKLGAILDDDAYYEKLYDIFDYTKTQHGANGLYSTTDHLWWRDGDFDPPYTTPSGEDEYWSRGNGWVFAGLARSLDVMPTDAPHRDELALTFQEMAAALVPIQRPDGFWNVSLHDPNNFGGPETSGTAFFTYGLAWGLNNGLLEGEEYLQAAVAGWNGMAADALHPDGFLGYVQATGKQPSDGQPVSYTSVPDFEDYGLGAFLLAGSEVFLLEDTSVPRVPGDVDGDGFVDAIDLDIIAANFRQPGGLASGDLSGDFVVDLADFRIWKQHYAGPVGYAWPAANVPEPSAATIACLLVAAALRRRCRSGRA